MPALGLELRVWGRCLGHGSIKLKVVKYALAELFVHDDPECPVASAMSSTYWLPLRYSFVLLEDLFWMSDGLGWKWVVECTYSRKVIFLIYGTSERVTVLVVSALVWLCGQTCFGHTGSLLVESGVCPAVASELASELAGDMASQPERRLSAPFLFFLLGLLVFIFFNFVGAAGTAC